MNRYFGTDGIRGREGDALVNPAFARRVGAAVAKYYRQRSRDKPLVAVIGRDPRESGPELAEALIRGMNQESIYVHDIGVAPTPALAQVILERHADFGIVVTASHNPASDNGIKIFDGEGLKLAADVEEAIEGLIDEQPDAEQTERAKAFPFDGVGYYIDYLRSLMDEHCLCDWRIVLDLANGAACETAPAVFRRWKPELITLGDAPDGENINHGVGSEYPERLGEAVRDHRAHLGIAHDGDGDRVVVCDETGAVLEGEELLGLFALHKLRARTLRRNTLVTTEQSNLGLDHSLGKEGGRVDRVPIGDRNVAHRMREIGATLGGESSGHIIFADAGPTGDGLIAAVKLLGLMRRTGQPLSALRREVHLFPHQTRNLRVAEKTPLKSLPRLTEAIRSAEAELGDSGRVMARYSGTEPKLRLLAEGPDAATLERVMANLVAAARADLTVIDS